VNTGYATIITPIGEGHAEGLKHFLRTEVEPPIEWTRVQSATLWLVAAWNKSPGGHRYGCV